MTQSAFLTRRNFLATASLAATSTLFSRRLFAQDSAVPAMVMQARTTAASAKVTMKPLRGNVQALMGSGGNIAVLPGKDGAVLIDSQFATEQPQIMAALNGISAGAPKHLINTHWHFDHTDGNEWMHAAGATITAHENCAKRLVSPQTIAAFKVTFPAAPKGAIPTETFASKKTMHLNGATLELAHYEPAHTDTDISIYFTEADVFHAGDTWFNGFYPFIDVSTGGSIDGMIRATQHNLSQVSAKTIIIPGHGPVGDKVQLAEFLEVLSYAREQVAALKKQGKTLDEVIAAKPTDKYDAKWGAGKVPTMFLGIVYEGV